MRDTSTENRENGHVVGCDEEQRAAYDKWMRCVSETNRDALASLGEREMADAFYKDLSFGTGGLRGKLGVGPNRMNVYTVGKATQGLANYLNAHFERPRVVLCRDTRNGGEEFVRRAAEVLAANGVVSYAFERPEPTPLLSFAVRELGCSAGVNITASHNPAEYNGYKVDGADGCQITPEAACAVQAEIDAVDPFDGVKAMPLEEARGKGLVGAVPESVIDSYIEETLGLSTGEDCSGLRIAYTPLHGVGLECVSRALRGIGVPDIELVEEQCVQDGGFPTCPRPNPEEREALGLGLGLCAEAGSDLLLATDPDADRVGVAVLHGGGYELLSGNEVGLLLLDFLCAKASSKGADLSRKVAVTTVVSAPMADDLARARGVELRRTLTGFKFIGEQIALLESEGRAADFLLGFEESYGYLAGAHVRDKDAVVASMLVCELAAHWKRKGLDLYEAMEGLYRRHGFWGSSLLSVAYEGPRGGARMAGVMEALRADPPEAFSGIGVSEPVDYSAGVAMPSVNPSGEPQRLPAADVLELRLEDGSRVLFRPSGTEPKVKSYVFAKSESREGAGLKLEALEAAARAILEGGRAE